MNNRLRGGAGALGLVLVLALVLGGCDPFDTTFEDREVPRDYEAQELIDAEPLGDDLLIMNWNVKYAGGRLDFWFDCWGDRVVMERSEVVGNLDGLVAKIRQVDPDILMVQEIDIDSKRGAYIDQVQWILDRTDLNYAMYAAQWRADFVPSDGLGRMNMGNAIFSKYPLRDGRRLALPQSEAQPAVERYFYLNRHILGATVDLPDYGVLELVNFHADAYSQDGTKKIHIDLIKEELDRLASAGQTFVGGGDLNTLPPNSQVQHDFADARCEDEAFSADDYRAEADWLSAYYDDFEAAIPLADYAADNEPYLTHSVHESVFWTRKLDYLFTNGTFVEGSGLTHQDRNQGGMETMPLSDHAPLTVRFELEAQ